MIFTKEHQQRLIDKYVIKNPNATALQMQSYIEGVEEGILQHMKHIDNEKKLFNNDEKIS